MKSNKKSIVEIHLAVLLFGLSGLFGKLINQSSIIIVLGRVFFSSIFLFIGIIIFKKSIKLKSKKDYIYVSIMGGILALHWFTFFKAIQVSTVSIGLFTFSTFAVFVTFLEPLFFKERIKGKDIVVALITIGGVALILPDFNIHSNITEGVLYGITSALTYAILSIMNKKFVGEYSSLIISFYEQLVATIVLIPFAFIYKPVFSTTDIIFIIILGLFFTAIAHSLFINGLKGVKTQAASIICSLEPVYGVLFAAIILKEMPPSQVLMGGSVILATSIYSTLKH
ncbi:DMT family transporter [Clostridium sp.]|uniref:DMT family transporter n=1 Tax=Clostridium sp. TaxID=1506 RepID=UPI003464BCFA